MRLLPLVIHAVAEAQQIDLQGAGASFPNRLYQDAIFAYKSENPSVTVTYTSTGSGSGKCRIMSWNETCTTSDFKAPAIIDFAGSDSLLKDSEYAAYSDLQMYPTVAGAVVPIYNLPTRTSGDPKLVLKPATVSRIFRAAITMWNDPEILTLNPELNSTGKLPAEPIRVVVREDKSGTTEIWKKGLAAFEAEFASQIGTSSHPEWSLPVNATPHNLRDTNAGVGAFVSMVPYSMGYSVLAEADALGLDISKLRKESGTDVEANVDSVESALLEKGTNWNVPVERLTADVHDATGPDAWPIAGYTYLVMRKNTTHVNADEDCAALGSDSTLTTCSRQSCTSRAETVAFWRWFYTSEVARSMSARNGFAALPGRVRDQVRGHLETQIYCDNQLVYTPPVVRQIRGVGFAALKHFSELFIAAYSTTSTFLIDKLGEITFTSQDSHAALEISAASVTDSSAYAVVQSKTITQAQAASSIVLPYAGFGYAVIYTICGSELDVDCLGDADLDAAVSSYELVLDITTLADLLDGEISTWADGRLTEHNPWLMTYPANVTFANYNVTLFGLNATDETMQTLQTLLQAYKPSFALKAFDSMEGESGRNAAVIKSTDELVKSAVINTPLSVGIVPVTASLHRLLNVAPLVNPRNVSQTMLPIAESVMACAEATTELTDANGLFDGRFDLGASTSVGCYPLSVALAVVLRQSFTGSECEGSRALPRELVQFLAWTLGEQHLPDDDLANANARATEREKQAQPLVGNGMAALTMYNPDFVQAQLQSVTCDGLSIINLDCPAGYVRTVTAARVATCEPCPAGTYELNHDTCVKVTSLQYALAGSALQDVRRCTDLRANTRHQKLVVEDGELTLQPEEGAGSLSDCTCEKGFYVLAVDASDERCVECPDGADCRGGFFLPEAKRGYALLAPPWAPPNITLAPMSWEPKFITCHNWAVCHQNPSDKVCDCIGGTYALGNSTYSDTTAIEALGTLQHQTAHFEYKPYQCNDEAYKEGSHLCHTCNDGYALSLGKCLKCTADPFWYNVAAVIYTMAWFPILRYLITTHCRSLYTSVAYIQFLGLYSEISLNWGKIGDLFEACAFFNLNLDAIQFDCGTPGARITPIVQIFLPFLYPIVCLVSLGGSKLLAATSYCSDTLARPLHMAGWLPRRDFSVQAIVRSYMPAWIFYLNLYWYSGGRAAMELLLCKEDNAGGSYLVTDPSMQCWQGEHLAYVACATVGITIYTLMLPGMLVYVLMGWARQVGLQDRTLQQLWGFLFQRFRPAVYQWELLESARKLLFVFVFSFGMQLDSELLRAFVVMATILPVACAEVALHPFQSQLYDLLEQFTTITELLILMLGIMMTIEGNTDLLPNADWTDALCWIFVVVSFALIAFAICTDEYNNYVWRKLRVRRRVTSCALSESLFYLRARNSLLLDWLGQANEKVVTQFREVETMLLRNAVLSLSLDSSSPTARAWYKAQAELDPFLLNRYLQSNSKGASFRKLRSKGVESVESELKRRGVDADNEVMSFLPAILLFDKFACGRVLFWVAEISTEEERKKISTVFSSIESYERHRTVKVVRCQRLQMWFDTISQTKSTNERDAQLSRLWETATAQGAHGRLDLMVKSRRSMTMTLDNVAKLEAVKSVNRSLFHRIVRGINGREGSFAENGRRSSLDLSPSDSGKFGRRLSWGANGRRSSCGSNTSSDGPSDTNSPTPSTPSLRKKRLMPQLSLRSTAPVSPEKPGSNEVETVLLTKVLREVCQQLPCEYALFLPANQEHESGAQPLIVGVDSQRSVKLSAEAFSLRPGGPAGDCLATLKPLHVPNVLLSRKYRGSLGRNAPISVLAIPVLEAPANKRHPKQEDAGPMAVLLLANKVSAYKDRAGLPFSLEDEALCVLFAETLLANYKQFLSSRGTSDFTTKGGSVLDLADARTAGGDPSTLVAKTNCVVASSTTDGASKPWFAQASTSRATSEAASTPQLGVSFERTPQLAGNVAPTRAGVDFRLDDDDHESAPRAA